MIVLAVCAAIVLLIHLALLPFFLEYRRHLFLDKLVYGVRVGIYNVLKEKFSGSLEKEYAGYLAAAVTNELFSVGPGNEIGRKFLNEHKTEVEKRLSELAQDPKLCKLVCETVKVQIKLSVKKTHSKDPKDVLKYYESLDEPLQKLEKYGLIGHSDANREARTSKEMKAVLVPIADQFFEERGRFWTTNS